MVNQSKNFTGDEDHLFFDQAARASILLDHILHADDEAVNPDRPLKPEPEQIAVEEAIQGRQILDFDTGRTKSRVAFVTTDQSVLELKSQAASNYVKLAALFDEVHVMVLIGRDGKDGFVRVSKNVWFYQIRSKGWGGMVGAAVSAAYDALSWNDIPRPDIIVGTDPFMAGMAAYEIAREFQRPLQIQIKEEIFDPGYSNSPETKAKFKLAEGLLKHVGSVRCATSKTTDALKKKFPKIPDVRTLPHFYDFAGFGAAVPAMNLREKYKNFAFVMVAFGDLVADSHLHDVFLAFRNALLNPRIGLIVVGDGPAKNLFMEKVRLLGIEKSVVFIKQAEDLVSYYKTVDLYVETDTSEDSEIRVLRAAAAGAPMLAYSTPLRADLFIDGQSAFLCEPNNIQCLSQYLVKFLNNIAIRLSFRQNAMAMAKDRLQEDKDGYFAAFRDTIEAVLRPTPVKEKSVAK